jgi:hypothetical protein
MARSRRDALRALHRASKDGESQTVLCIYSEAGFLVVMREAVTLAETWSAIAPRPEDDSFAPSKADPVPTPPRRTAA